MILIHKLFFESLPSTNTYAKENIADLPTPSLIIADKQTAGRGRRGNSFFSPENTGLYMTLVFKEKENSELITPISAVAVCETLEETGITPKIKWVNDIFLNGKKVCGILAERHFADSEPYIVLGIGINISTRFFPDELKQAGSINIECDKEKLAEDISEKILEYTVKASDIIDKYRTRLFIIGKEISYFKNNIEYKGTVTDINGKCNLIVKLPDGKEDVLLSGEISIII